MKDVKELLLAARSGSEEAFSDIVRQYTPMMQSVARKYEFDFDEVFSDLCMSLYRAVNSYNAGHGEITFGLYAKICAERAMLDIAKRQRRDADAISDSDVEEIANEDDLTDEIIRREEGESLRRDAREILSGYEYDVLVRWLGGDKTADIAKALGVSAKSVDNAKARILKKLRDGLKPRGR